MSRVLTFIVVVTIGQFLLGYLMFHLGFIALAGLGWWIWSFVEGRRHG